MSLMQSMRFNKECNMSENSQFEYNKSDYNKSENNKPE